MRTFFLSVIRTLFFEQPARRRDYARLAADLEAGARELDARLAAAADTPTNLRLARHIIGLERWGQRRLRIALGDPPVSDEMDGYEPPPTPHLSDLRATFAATRRETLVLVRQLELRHIPGDLQIPHNQFGPLTVRGWLVYLNQHARLEGRRLKA